MHYTSIHCLGIIKLSLEPSISMFHIAKLVDQGRNFFLAKLSHPLVNIITTDFKPAYILLNLDQFFIHMLLISLHSFRSSLESRYPLGMFIIELSSLFLIEFEIVVY